MFRRRSSHKKPSEDFYSDFKNSFPRLTHPPLTSPTGNPTEETIQAFAKSAEKPMDQVHKHEQLHEMEFQDMHDYVDDSRQMHLIHSPDLTTYHGHNLHAGFNSSVGPHGHWSQMPANGMPTPLSASDATSINISATVNSYSRHQGFGSVSNDFSNQHSAAESLPSFPAGDYDRSYMDVLHGNHEYDHAMMFSSNYPSAYHNTAHPNRFHSLPVSEFGIPTELQKWTNQFRFPVVLQAPTAMINSSDEMPLTYLNKCAPYTVKITDSNHPKSHSGPLQYRTSLRVSFDDDEKRERPGAFWQLWLQSRGEKEASQHGTSPMAMERVKPDQSQMMDHHGNIKITKTCFDGFSFQWSPSLGGESSCSVQVRFNFLSTDFSHSKGVKGIPLRLCATTEVIGQDPSALDELEVSYCYVKLFRDHGAERKIANDRAHIKKLITKIEAQENSSPKDGKKRRRSSAAGGQKPAKKMRGTSIDSGSSLGVGDFVEDEVQTKLRSLSEAEKSIRSESWFLLKGDSRDDIDNYPVELPGTKDIPGDEPTISSRSDRRNTAFMNSLASDTSESRSPIPRRVTDSSSQYPHSSTSISRESTWNEERQLQYATTSDVRHANPQHLASPSEGPTKIEKILKDGDGTSPEWFQARDVDQKYRAPPKSLDQPVACFYIKPIVSGEPLEDENYRAIYLSSRTVRDLTRSICAKCEVSSTSVSSVVRVNAAGLHIKVEDEMVEKMAENQDLVTELDLEGHSEYASDDIFNDGDSPLPSYRLTLRF